MNVNVNRRRIRKKKRTRTCTTHDHKYKNTYKYSLIKHTHVKNILCRRRRTCISMRTSVSINVRIIKRLGIHIRMGKILHV